MGPDFAANLIVSKGQILRSNDRVVRTFSLTFFAKVIRAHFSMPRVAFVAIYSRIYNSLGEKYDSDRCEARDLKVIL